MAHDDYLKKWALALVSKANQSAHESSSSSVDESHTALIDRVRRVLNSLPEEIKANGVQLEYMRERLRGAKGRKAHAGSVGDCLRALGWRRVREWKKGHAGFRARWYPPADRG